MAFDTVPLRLALVLLLSAFMPLTAVSYFRFRLGRKRARYQRTLELLDLGGDDSRQLELLPSESFHPRSFLLPVVFVTVLSALGFTHLFFGNEILGTGGSANLLLGGTAALDGLDDGSRAERLSLLVVVIAFTTSFLWSCVHLFRRLIAGDLHPGAYYSAGLRMCFAPLLALMIAWIPGVTGRGLGWVPAIAFLTGLFPRRALHWLNERIALFGRQADEVPPLPLHAIEGLSAFDRMRLSEVAIDNAQALAHARLTDLLAETPYGAGRLIDWIAQAKLYVIAKERMGALRRAGVREALTFQDLCRDDEARWQLGEMPGLDAAFVELAAHTLGHDPHLDRLRSYRRRLAPAPVLATGSES